jgi:hypothetical protein
MSKTRNKSASRRKHGGAARKGSPSRHKRPFAIDDRLRVVDIPEDLKDPDYDLKDADYREMRTAELFRFCLGREFTVQGFDKLGYVELRADKNRAVRGKFGFGHSIWIEPEFLKRVRMHKQQKD